jgi:hypothetical protein
MYLKELWGKNQHDLTIFTILKHFLKTSYFSRTKRPVGTWWVKAAAFAVAADCQILRDSPFSKQTTLADVKTSLEEQVPKQSNLYSWHADNGIWAYLKGLSYKIGLAFDDMHGQFKA